jgi:shikimate kinase
MFGRDKTENLFLAGMMGTGKTTVGRRLSEMLGYEFVDTDACISESTELSIVEMFDTSGESEFRRLESELLESICARTHQVIATGGGMFAQRNNLKLAVDSGLVVLLYTAPAVLEQRLSRSNERPLLRGLSTRDAVRQVMEERMPVYDLIPLKVDTGIRSVQECSLEVAGMYREWLQS